MPTAEMAPSSQPSDTRDPSCASPLLAQIKHEARRRARIRRKRALCSLDNDADALACNFLRRIDLSGTVSVAGYWPMGSEMDVRSLLTALHALGVRILLPEVLGPTNPLGFRNWAPGIALESGPFGIPVPAGPRCDEQPSILLIPLLAFDRLGFRLGQGGGYYDRTLAAIRRTRRAIRAIGIAYAAQEIPLVPREHHDQKLDGVATERFVVQFT